MSALDPAAALRDQVRHDVDESADRDDASARSRDLQALARDKRSSDRDVAARRLDDDRDPGFGNRWHSAGDRDDSGGDRSDAFDDRRRSSNARRDAAKDRARAARDRDVAAARHSELEEQVRGLEENKASGHVIGQAVGLLIGRLGVSSTGALAILRRRSRDTNTRLPDMAAQIVADAQPGTAERRQP